MKKVVLITGATSGIGLATAKLFGKNQYKVLLNGIDDVAGEKAVKELKEMNISAEYYGFDVTDEEAVAQNLRAIGKKHKRLDALVNNAGGLGGRSRFSVMTTEFYKNVLALNLDSVFYVTRAALPMLKLGENPSIINFASNAGWNGGGLGAGIYATAKAAIVTLTRAMAKDFAEFGIRVNAVSPGTIDTPFHDATRKNNPELFESFKNNILMKRLGKPEEVASVIKFLCSDEASFMTGEVVQINGGQDLL